MGGATEVPGKGDAGFDSWVEHLAVGLFEMGSAFADVSEPDGFAGSRDFLLSGRGLGGVEGWAGVRPGFYEIGDDRRRAGEDLLSSVWSAAWEEIDGGDCDLRVISVSDPHEDEGEVIGLDLTSRNGSPHGTLLFREQPAMHELVCGSEKDLRDLYRWAWRS